MYFTEYFEDYEEEVIFFLLTFQSFVNKANYATQNFFQPCVNPL